MAMREQTDWPTGAGGGSDGERPRRFGDVARMDWTPALIARLTELWQAGKSAGQIAVALDCGLTRNAVIGKLNRLGIQRGVSASSAAQETPSPAAPAIPAPALRIAAPAPLPARIVPKPEPAPIVFGPCEPVTIADLEDCNCHWPLGDPASDEFRFCGRPKPGAGPYCAEHHKLAHVPTLRPVVRGERRRPTRFSLL